MHDGDLDSVVSTAAGDDGESVCGSNADLEAWLGPEPPEADVDAETLDRDALLREVRTSIVGYLQASTTEALTMNQVCLRDEKKVLGIVRSLAKLTKSSRQRGDCMHFLELANPNDEFWTWDKQVLTNPKLIRASLKKFQ